MGEWEQRTLGDLLTLQRGFDLPTQDRSAGSVPVVASTGIVAYHNKAQVKGPGVVIGRSGSIGGGQYIRKDFWPLNTTLWVKDFKGNDPQFCYYLLKQIDFSAFNSGSGVPTLNRNHVHPLPVSYPDTQEQRAIANVLSSLDDKIELNLRMNATLEGMAQAIFRDWFVDFGPVRRKLAGATDPVAILGGLIPNPDRAAHIAALFPDGLGDDDLPVGWNDCRLTELMDIQGGTQPPKSEFVYEPTPGYVRLLQIRDFERDNHPTYVKDRKSLKKLSTYDTAIGRYGAAVGRICWGRNGAYNVALAKVVPNLHTDNEFLRCVVKSTDFQSYLAAISGRSAQAGFNKNDLSGYDLCGGSVAIRAAFSDFVLPMREKQIQVDEESRILADTRDYLLPRLMSGKVRVADAERLAG